MYPLSIAFNACCIDSLILINNIFYKLITERTLRCINAKASQTTIVANVCQFRLSRIARILQRITYTYIQPLIKLPICLKNTYIHTYFKYLSCQ